MRGGTPLTLILWSTVIGLVTSGSTGSKVVRRQSLTVCLMPSQSPA